MAQNFVACDREQELVLPPGLRAWLAEGHFAWFVLDAVEAMDLRAFVAGYRDDGWGRAAHDPAVMVALLLDAYAVGERSSRRIERRCVEDVAVRVITANHAPDHTTIARVRQRHEAALGALFGEVLAVCAEAGIVQVKVVAIDGTKVHANASQHATRDYEQIAREILEEAGRVDADEDEQFGERRGDELPPELATAQGRRGWLREAKRRLDAQRAEEARPIPASRPQRLKESKRRLEEELDVECRANAAYEAYRARGRMKDGRRFGRPPDPYLPPATPAGKINVTDPDSRNVKTSRGWVQGYNAQAVCTERQIVIAAEVTVDSPDFGHLEPMIAATETELTGAGISAAPEVVLADAGYWHSEQMQPLTGRGTVVLIPPDAGKRKGARPGWDGGLYAFMRRVLATDQGGDLYAKRQGMIEPIFAQTKFNRRCDRFQRRGRAACRSEWRLITATHNLLKLHTHTIATASA
jgi:transposase